MKIDPVTLVNRLLWIAILFPIATFGDQTDNRLDKLFATLQSNENAVVQNETILTIWKVWYESGREDIDKLMEEGEEAARSGQLERAEQVFTQVIQIAPAFSEGWNRRATVRYHRLDYAGSLDDIKRTLVLEPRHFGEITPYSRDTIRRIELLKKELEQGSA